jgi:hypothetical protein
MAPMGMTPATTLPPTTTTPAARSQTSRAAAAAAGGGGGVGERSGSERQLRRARIVITLQRTHDYQQWLLENPLQAMIAGDGDDDDEVDDDDAVESEIVDVAGGENIDDT